MIDLWKNILYEDLKDKGDITTSYLNIPNKNVSAHVVAKEPGIYAGEVPVNSLAQLYKGHTFIFIKHDGDPFLAQDILIEIDGYARGILEFERSLINVLQMLCGIATETKEWADVLNPVKVLDTRKTHPLLRGLEKYAVTCGTGTNHRFGLYDTMMVKDNHIQLLDNLDDVSWQKEMVVEVDTIELLEYILKQPVGWIMLDNWPYDTLKETVARIRKERPDCIIEVSGGIQFADLPLIRKARPDYVSTSKITLGAPSLDISLNIIA